MDRIIIEGGKPLNGAVVIGGAKNAALPIMCASLLSDEPLVLSNIPHLADITTMAHLLTSLGVQLEVDCTAQTMGFAGRTLALHAEHVPHTTAHYDIVRKMRASVLVLGPLLARCEQAKVSLPGGCAIGSRPVDLHLGALEAMGAQIELDAGYIIAKAPGGLKGAEIEFAKVSVGATENILMAATLADGVTVLKNAACEPEVVDLANCLTAMGAQIEGIGTNTLTITGVEKLHGAAHRVMPDRIEAGTYAAAAAITGGELELLHCDASVMTPTLKALRDAGVAVEEGDGIIRVKADTALKPFTLETQPYPGFPTDMQAQLMTLACLADGESRIRETIFENRFMHVPELQRMGADITVDGNEAVIRGVKAFNPAEVMATDLRASVSLVLAALATEGATTINRVYHIDRGYEWIEDKLRAVGANITRERG